MNSKKKQESRRAYAQLFVLVSVFLLFVYCMEFDKDYVRKGMQDYAASPNIRPTTTVPCFFFNNFFFSIPSRNATEDKIKHGGSGPETQDYAASPNIWPTTTVPYFFF